MTTDRVLATSPTTPTIKTRPDRVSATSPTTPTMGHRSLHSHVAWKPRRLCVGRGHRYAYNPCLYVGDAHTLSTPCVCSHGYVTLEQPFKFRLLCEVRHPKPT